MKQRLAFLAGMPLLPLEGFTVGVTADRRADEQSELLRRRGAQVMAAPVIATGYLGSDERLCQATTELVAHPPDYLVATTAIGIRAWIEAAQSWGLDRALLDALAPARVIARGPKAAAAAQAMGLEVWATAADERMDGVRELLREAGARARVAVQCFGEETQKTVAALAGPDRQVTAIPVYRWEQHADTGPVLSLVRAALDERVHAITFTSAPSVRYLFQIAASEGADGDLRLAFNHKLVAACVGPACADVARELGIVDVVAPAVGRLGLMVRSLCDRLQTTRRVLSHAGTTVELQGHAVLVGDRHVLLTRREAGVLTVLADRPGAVVSPLTLLRTLWGNAPADEHVVEVTVGRLRRKLGPAGAFVVNVPRRGYRLSAESSTS